ITTLAPSFAAISRVVFQPGSVRTSLSVFCFKSAISASCFPGFTFSRVIKITDSSDMVYPLAVSDTPRTTRRGETDRSVENFLENPFEATQTFIETQGKLEARAHMS